MSHPPQDPYDPSPTPTHGEPSGYVVQPPPGQPAPVAYDPGFAAPQPATTPGSGPPYDPYAAPPVSGPPPYSVPSGPPGAPPARGRPVVLLAVAAALLFVVSGVLTGLFLSATDELDTTRQKLTAQVNERDDTIDGKNDEISKLQGDLERARADLDRAKQSLTGTQNERDEVEQEKQVIAKCLTLFSQSMNAALDGDRATVNRLSGALDKACTEAERYV